MIETDTLGFLHRGRTEEENVIGLKPKPNVLETLAVSLSANCFNRDSQPGVRQVQGPIVFQNVANLCQQPILEYNSTMDLLL